ncbi:MAG: hypothetical protein NVSMB51_20500 [Solirubrobacteraceae bacterium]
MNALASLLRAEGGLLGPLVRKRPGHSPLAALTARGPRGDDERALVVAAVHEGYLLHYGGEPAVLDCGDPDLALLAGDRLYALGLERLVALGDVEAVVELADVISLSALAHARGEPELAALVWRAGALAVGWGGDSTHEQAKRLAWAGDPRAARAMGAAAERERYS